MQRLRAGIREHRDGDHIAGAHSERALLTRSTEAGKRASAAPVRVGRRVNSPPQFGQRLEKRASVHAAQNVHAKEQMRASSLSGGRLRSQGQGSSLRPKAAMQSRHRRRTVLETNTVVDERLVQPTRVIAAHLAEWGSAPAYVELAVFGTDEPRAIAREIDRFCRTYLGAEVAEALFHQSSVGSVAGVQLDDGRRVVIKGHQPSRSVPFLREVARVQMYIASLGLPAPRVLGGPAPLGLGNAVAEAFIDTAMLPRSEPHQPDVRRAMAASLYAIVAACRPLVAGSSLPRHLLADPPLARLWPTPHSRLFDFEATAGGSDYIDAVAREARRLMRPAGELVIGHGDWRAEHVRFKGSVPVVAFDWDSLCREYEPALVGCTAHAFCADWSTSPPPPAPTLDEARAFVAHYESARGKPFRGPERRLCGAAFAYACAYTARCGHAIDATAEREHPGSFGALVAREGLRLLEV